MNFLKVVTQGEPLHFRFSYNKTVHPDKVLFQVFRGQRLEYEVLFYASEYKTLIQLVNEFGAGLEKEMNIDIIDGEVITGNLLN